MSDRLSWIYAIGGLVLLSVGLLIPVAKWLFTDSGVGKWTSLGSEAQITCWSASHKIYEGRSTGKPLNESGSDGYFFKEKGTNQFVEISGDCVIRYAEAE